MTDEQTTPPPKARPPALVTGGELAPIIPRTVDEMFRLATAFHISGLTPQTLDSPEKVMVAILAGAELGMAPNQAVQAFYVVNNRPTLWGDAIPALLWSNGFKLREWYEGEGDKLTAHCEVTRPTGEVIPGEFSIEDARLADLLGKRGPWQTARKRMLKMRARAFAARDGAADVLKGMQIKEEVDDYGPEPAGNGPQGRSARQREGTGLLSRLTGREANLGAQGGFSTAHVARETGKTAVEEIGDDIPAQFTGADAQVGGHDPVTAEVFEAEFKEVDITQPCEHCGAAAGEACRPECGAGTDFPGDKPSPEADVAREALGLKTGAQMAEDKAAEAAKPTAERVAELKAQCEAPGVTAVQLAAFWRKASDLKRHMDNHDPEGFAELEEWFTALFAKVDDAEKARQQ